MKCNFQNRTKYITEYLTGVLSEDEMSFFEDHYFHCNDCFEELKISQDAIDILKDEGPSILDNQTPWWSRIVKSRCVSVVRNPFRLVTSSRTSMPAHTSAIGSAKISHNLAWPKRKFKIIYVTICLAIIVICAILIINPFTQSSKSKSKSKSKLENIQPYPYMEAQVLEGSENSQKQYKEGMKFYQKGDYDQAIQKLVSVKELDPNNMDGIFYLGVSYLLQNRIDDAIEILKIAVRKNPHSEKEHWYLGKALLKKGNREEALEEFEIVNKLNQERYSNPAKVIIIEIEK
jgi:tetratricopeptide (TPR) repeat protein